MASNLSLKKRVALRLTRGAAIRFEDGRYSMIGGSAPWWSPWAIRQRPYRWLRRNGLIDVDGSGHVFVTDLGKTYL